VQQPVSDVARLTAQIEAEYAAAFAGLHGLAAGTVRHDVITAKMCRAQEASDELTALVGEEAAKPLIVAALDGAEPH
jgi:hypothetical protein